MSTDRTAHLGILSYARWTNAHPDAQEVLEGIRRYETAMFYADPHVTGLLLAEDEQSYVLRAGALLGAKKINRTEAAALVRGLGVTLLNPDEGPPP